MTESITFLVKAEAQRLGFELVGVTLPSVPQNWDHFRTWLDQGFAGEMDYLNKGAAVRRSMDSLLPGTKSLLVLGVNYRHSTPVSTGNSIGRIAQYASGKDYHEVLWAKLNELSDWLQKQVPGSQSRGVVDTAPLMERDAGQQAGLGWFGKNTMLINKRMGSYYFIATLLTTVELEPDAPHLNSHCGTCTACLDACPTHAFPQPGVLDATKCISYLTIELKSPIPRHLRTGLGNWVFGCDICQDVCPWNRKAPLGKETQLFPQISHLELDELIALLALSPDEFRAKYRHTALWRAKRRGIVRNAAVVLGNLKATAAIPALIRALADMEPLIRGAAAWALGQFSQTDLKTILQSRLEVEPDTTVQEELRQAIVEIDRLSQIQ